MDLHEIFSIGPQWANRYEVTLNLTQPHLPSFIIVIVIITAIPLALHGALTLGNSNQLITRPEHSTPPRGN